jgi:hypothetical protein
MLAGTFDLFGTRDWQQPPPPWFALEDLDGLPCWWLLLLGDPPPFCDENPGVARGYQTFLIDADSLFKGTLVYEDSTLHCQHYAIECAGATLLMPLAQTQQILDPTFCHLVVNAITWAIQGASLHLSLVVKTNACHSGTKQCGVVMSLLVTHRNVAKKANSPVVSGHRRIQFCSYIRCLIMSTW